FYDPYGVALDAAGNVYVADLYNHRIQRFTSAGVYVTQFGSLGSENGQLRVPYDVAVDAAGNVFVADTNNQRIQKFAFAPTPTAQETWGGVKARYRQEGAA